MTGASGDNYKNGLETCDRGEWMEVAEGVALSNRGSGDSLQRGLELRDRECRVQTGYRGNWRQVPEVTGDR